MTGLIASIGVGRGDGRRNNVYVLSPSMDRRHRVARRESMRAGRGHPEPECLSANAGMKAHSPLSINGGASSRVSRNDPPAGRAWAEGEGELAMVDRRLVWLIVLAAVLFAVIVLANQQLLMSN